MADPHERLVGAMLVTGHAQQDTTTLSVLTQLTAGGRYFTRIQSPAGGRLPQLNERECDELILLLSKAKSMLQERNR